MIKQIGYKACALIGALIGSQIPQFFHYYTQRLAGHVDALYDLTLQLQKMAASSHKTLEQYTQKFKQSTEPDIIMQGDFLQYIQQQYVELSAALKHLVEGSVWLKPYYFLQDIQPSIAHSTLQSFKWGFSFTTESAFYALLGLFAFWLLARGIVFGISWIYKLITGK